MIEEQAVVVGIEHDQAVLEILRNKPCGLCGQTRGCGISVWGRLFGQRNKVFLAANQLNARAGDSVVVGVDEKALLAGSLAAYGVPLLMLLVGAVLTGMFVPVAGNADGQTLAGAGIGLALGLWWSRRYAGRSGQSGRYRPVLLRFTDASPNYLSCHRGEK